MSASLSFSSASAFRPVPNETLFYDTLVVGETLAAYTATLAILQAGGQVCWVKPERGDEALTSPLQGKRLGPRRFQLSASCRWSRSQHQFWQQERLGKASPVAQLPGETPGAPAIAKTQRLRQGLAPYLSNQQLVLIPGAVPVQVLYSQAQQQRRVHQVVFQGVGQRFQVHCGLTLDATAQGILARLLEKSGEPLGAAQVVLAQVVLTEADRYPTRRSLARGTCFDDTIGVVAALADRGPEGARSRPMTVPLRSLIPKDTDGFLRVGQPGSVPALQPLWQQPSVQWALGEAAGHIAALSAQAPDGFRSLLKDDRWRRRVQGQLTHHGIPIFAFDDVDHHDPDFEAIQVLAAAGIVRSMSDRDLHFRPETPVTRAVAATALVRLTKPKKETPAPTFQDIFPTHWAWQAVTTAVTAGLMPLMGAKQFGPSKVLSRQQLFDLVQTRWPEAKLPPFSPDQRPARRRHLSRLLYSILRNG